MTSSLLRHSCLAVLGTLALVASPLAAHAVQLDTPTLSVEQTGATSIVLRITSGPSGTPGGFSLDWMKKSEFDANGWPIDPSAVNYCQFIGEPTLNTTWGTTTFLLGADEEAMVQVGDLLDESGMYGNNYDELLLSTEYVFRVRADAVAGADQSNDSPNLLSSTAPPQGQSGDCTVTIGYWKTHGPGPGCLTGNNSNEWPVASLTLGAVSYTASQLCSILNQPTQGNGLVSMAKQLIAAKLNDIGGASLTPAVQTAINQADALIGGLVIPPVGSGSLPPNQTSGLTQIFDDYNNGVTGPGHCVDGGPSTTATEPTTWGSVKGLYQ